MPDEEGSAGRREDLVEALHRRRQVVGEGVEVGTRGEHRPSGVAPHERVPDDRITRVENQRDRSGRVAGSVEHRPRHAEIVEPHAVGGRDVRGDRVEGEMAEQAGQQPATEADPLERAVVAAVGQGLIAGGTRPDSERVGPRRPCSRSDRSGYGSAG